MERSSSFQRIFLLFSLLISYNLLYAGMSGFFIPVSTGRMNYEIYDSRVTSAGIGFVFDSNAGGLRLFNYRFSVGFEYFEHSYSYDEFSVYDPNNDIIYYIHHSGIHKFARLFSDHDFGFGLIRSESFRFWAGPNVRFGFIGADQVGMSLGLGITALGLNFNISRQTVISVTAGYLLNYDVFFSSIHKLVEFNGTDIYDKKIGSASSNLLKIELSILFKSRGGKKE